MKLDQNIKALELLSESIPTGSCESDQKIYSAIEIIINEINEYVLIKNNAGDNIGFQNNRMYFEKLKYPLKTLVGIENNGHSIEQNKIWCMGAFDRLRSKVCFNLANP